MNEFLKDLPPWAKAIIVLVILAIAIYFGKQLYDWFRTDKDTAAEQEKAKPVVSVKAAQDEISKLKEKAKTDNTQDPTYSADIYKSFADRLFTAMDGVGVNGTNVRDVFVQMKKRRDVLELINAYGIRQKTVFGYDYGAPMNLMQSLVDEKVIEEAKQGLKEHNVYYTF